MMTSILEGEKGEGDQVKDHYSIYLFVSIFYA